MENDKIKSGIELNQLFAENGMVAIPRFYVRVSTYIGGLLGVFSG